MPLTAEDVAAIRATVVAGVTWGQAGNLIRNTGAPNG